MNKAQKIIILITLTIIFLLIIYPPYLNMLSILIGKETWRKNVVTETGWDWIFNLKCEKEEAENVLITNFQKIRLDILVCEILAVGILARFLVLIVRKKR